MSRPTPDKKNMVIKHVFIAEMFVELLVCAYLDLLWLNICVTADLVEKNIKHPSCCLPNERLKHINFMFSVFIFANLMNRLGFLTSC